MPCADAMLDRKLVGAAADSKRTGGGDIFGVSEEMFAELKNSDVDPEIAVRLANCYPEIHDGSYACKHSVKCSNSAALKCWISL